MAISAAIFTALRADEGGLNWLPGVLTFAGRQDNIANLLMIVAAIIAIMVLVSKGKTCVMSPGN